MLLLIILIFSENIGVFTLHVWIVVVYGYYTFHIVVELASVPIIMWVVALSLILYQSGEPNSWLFALSD
jgi:hypothetical protein